MRMHLYNDTNAGNFADLLLQIGDGKIQSEEKVHRILIPPDLAQTTNDIETLIPKDKTYKHCY